MAAKVRQKPSLNKGLPVSSAFASATKSITSLKHSRRSSECHFYDHRRPIGNKSSIGCTSVLRSAARKKAVFMAEKMFPISAAKKSVIFLARKIEYKKAPPRKDVSTTYTLYQGASAPRHPRQQDVHRTSKQRGRLTRPCCRRLLRCKSPLGCLLIACDPDWGCQHQLTGVKIIAKKKPGGKPGEFFACYKRNKFIC